MMLNLTKEHALKIKKENDGFVTKKIYEPKLLFIAKYKDAFGDIWNLGEVGGILTGVRWVDDKKETPYGELTFIVKI